MRKNKLLHMAPQGGGGQVPQPVPQQQPVPQPQYAPAPQAPAQQYVDRTLQYAPLPPQQFQQPTQPQQGQPPLTPAQQQLSMDTVLNDPTLPQELRGKTLRDAVTYYNTVRDYALEQYRRTQQGGQQPQAQAQQQPQAPQGQAPQQPAPQGQQPQRPAIDRNQLFTQPEAAIGAVVQPMLDGVLAKITAMLDQRLAPVQNVVQQNAVQSSFAAVRQRYPDFAQYEGTILAELQNAPPEAITPAGVEAAYFYAVGKTQRTRPAAPQGQLPAPQSWFTESPSAPAASYPNGTPTSEAMARFADGFGIPRDQYSNEAALNAAGSTNGRR